MIHSASAGRGTSSVQRALIACTVVSLIGGCDGSSGSKGKGDCPVGSETCACYGNGTCDEGLSCASKLCVATTNGGAKAGGGASTAGTSPAGGGMPAFGGNVGSGGDVSAAGVAPGSGGLPAAGRGAGIGGSVGLGGATSQAGSSSSGAPSGGFSLGGTPNGNAGASTGGTLTTGGVASAGAPTSNGGAATNGGVTSSGGAVAAAGRMSTGGTSATQICGNGILEGTETCDPLSRNADLGDGCTPTCMAEPTCPPEGGPCTSRCGDGLVFEGEACDDGNLADGDGCSPSCIVEPGFVCALPPLGDTMVVPMVVRDFNAGGDFEKGTAFATGLNYANQGLLKATLDGNGLKPSLASTTGTYNGMAAQPSGIASPSSFAQWFDDNAPASGNTHSGTLATSLILYRKSDGSGYVNRFGNNGDGLTSAQYKQQYTYQCGMVGHEDHDASGAAIPCTACSLDEDTTTPQCDPPKPTICQIDSTYTGECVENSGAWMGTFLKAAYDGNPLWFPADALTPFSPSGIGQITGNYNSTWPSDASGAQRNFSFTTEVRFWFRYDSAKTFTLSISGDDDIWLFVNKRLALDMGGIHTPVTGDLTIASGTGIATARVLPTNVTPATPITSQPDLGGLAHGGVYEIAVFQAERQTRASSYLISLTGFNTARSVCSPQ